MSLVSHIADERKAIRMLGLLRKYLGCDLNHPDYCGRTLLSYAAESGSDSLVYYLINFCSADPNISDPVRGQTAIFYAAAGGNAETVELLHSCGARIDHVDKLGQTALFHATKKGHANVVAKLAKDLGCKTHTKDAWGFGAID